MRDLSLILQLPNCNLRIPNCELYMRFAIVDTETTGLSFTANRIIEIGIIIVDNNQVVDTFSSLIDPEEYIPNKITEITGITNYAIKGAPKFSDIAESLSALLEGCIFVAHNAAFDYGFIQTELARMNIAFHPPALCTVKLSRKLFPQHHRHSLAHIIERFQIETTDRHRALADAQVVWEFLQLLPQHFASEYIDLVMAEIIRSHKTPIQITPSMVHNLPERPGVYIFYDKDNTPLYIGKSINIKERVKQHFQQSTRENKEFAINQNLADIKVIPTAGELGALLLESKLVKEMYPLYNRQLRQIKKPFALIRRTNADGYTTVQGCYIHRIEPDQMNEIMGIFTSEKQAEDFLREACQEYRLCLKLLDLQKGSGACFNFHLKRCHGACIKKEEAALFNARFARAFEKTRLHIWPYEGSITITEESEDKKVSETFCINQWCVIEHKINDTVNLYPPEFNLDHYKIIRRFLNKS